MEGDTKIMALIQLAGISVLFLFKLVFDCIKRRNRPTVTSNPLATISAEAELNPITIYLCRIWSEQEEEGFERTTAAAMAKKISNDAGTSDDMDKSMEGGVRNTNNCDGNTTVNKLTSSSSKNEDAAHEVQNSAMGTRTTDSARVTKFTKELSGQMVILGTIYTLLLPE
ncbi:hypothetical protein ES288_A05G430800v1 [Gossypium darwinii]|uniref:Uncharacterized protein n=1 Tax=Gossypium darwinii TaxID=34276 RepID=A0A5D2GR24_GOSDA|nr:hypothetical protein ES288_A05G430800v1 [Gossypium darwinii]